MGVDKPHIRKQNKQSIYVAFSVEKDRTGFQSFQWDDRVDAGLIDNDTDGKRWGDRLFDGGDRCSRTSVQIITEDNQQYVGLGVGTLEMFLFIEVVGQKFEFIVLWGCSIENNSGGNALQFCVWARGGNCCAAAWRTDSISGEHAEQYGKLLNIAAKGTAEYIFVYSVQSWAWGGVSEVDEWGFDVDLQ